MILEKLINFAGVGKKKFLKVVILSSAMAVSPFVIAPAQAVNLLQNGSFEDTTGIFIGNIDGAISLNPGSTVIPGWTTTTAELAWLYNGRGEINTPFGAFFLDLTGIHDSLPYGGVTQTINTKVGQQYTLSLSLGTFNPTYSGPISVTATAGSSNQTFTYNPLGSGNQWGSFSLDFTATSASTPISIVGISTANIFYLGLDNVSVEGKTIETIPESSSLLGILSLGVLGIGTALKRKP